MSDAHQEPRAGTLIELLRSRAHEQPEELLYTFLDDAGGEEGTATYAELDRRARRLAQALRQHVAPGERAVLLYPPGLEYIAGFFGCLYSGLIAVPAYPPDPTRLERTLPRLRAIIQDAKAKVVLTTSFVVSMAEFMFEQAPDLASLRWVATDELPAGGEEEWTPPEAQAGTLAFLQYTSGSTGTPKGVMLSHGNLLSNLKLISHAFQFRRDSRGVIWLPPYHDMGLIGGILGPLYAGFPVVLLSPLTILKRPLRWVEAISRYGATISGGPNFAFDLCVRKTTPEEREALDLSRWRLAFTGAEPIRPETLDRFVEAFGPRGFRRESFYPCYGLAEATLIVTGGKMEEPPLMRLLDGAALERRQALAAEPGSPMVRALVGCGGELPEHGLSVVDPETRRPCAEGQVGEIWCEGPSVAQGYWQRPEETQRTFHAHTEDGRGPFLRTGDLGFLLGGELFLASRLKDLIIIRGRNHYPQDIEQTVEQSHPALRPGCVAAFAAEVEGEERLVIVQEVDTRREVPVDEVVAEVRARVARSHEVQLHALVLIEPGSIPKTSSGKIQRHACRAGFLGEGLRTVAVWREQTGTQQTEASPVEAAPENPRTPEELEAWLLARLQERLRVRREELDPATPITRYGLDSLSAVELTHDVESLLGVALPMEALLQGPSVAELARQLHARRESPGQARRETIARQPSEGELPLSFAQQRLWFLDQLEPGNPFYNIPAAIRLEGALDVPALERSFQEIFRRHESLRTRFSTADGQPVQVISGASAFQLPVVDLEAVPAGEREARAQRLLGEEARRPFELGTGPLLRARLLRLGAREHVLAVTMHHIASDGWSMGVLVRELSAIYPALSAGQPSPLAELPVQYADFTRWQRERLSGETLEAQLAYWREQLTGATQVLELPTDRPRPAVLTYRGAKQPVKLPRALLESVRELSRRQGTTPFMTLLAAFQVLLHRCSGQADISVGSPIAGRTRPELEGLIGFFVNTLVLRSDLSGDPSFLELLGRVRQTALGAYAHQEVPFEKLVEELHPVRSRSHSPLFQVMFVLLGGEQVQAPVLPGLEARALDVHAGTSMFDLTLTLTEGEQGLHGALEYSTDLFEASTIARMVARLEVLLEGIVAAPERRQVLVEWNATATPWTPECLHRLVEAQAARTPDAVALAFEAQQLTYRELDERATLLARHLRGLGVGTESVVGVFAERSPELVVGLLAILKAGAAYLPLDPAYPPERLAFMVEDSGARVVLTQRHLELSAPARGARLVLLDGAEPLATDGAPSLEGGAGPDNVAYVIYTSGSTGRPKGVMVPHRTVANFLTAMDARLGVPPQGAWLAVTSISFDISVLELFWSLTRGLRLVLQGESGVLRSAAARTGSRATSKPLGFSLFYFADDAETGGGDRYRLLMEGARFADRNGFEAVWTPERHFHAFGGLYPNPSVVSAAVAAITERVHIRAGSVVLPLHHPVRVAEEWALVDNLSRGRVGISFASGWHANDFVFAPERYPRRRELLMEGLDTVRRLWRGETLTFPGGDGNPVQVSLRPRPLQRELPFWLTAAGNPDTFIAAGRQGANILTHLLGQSVQDLEKKVGLYRDAWRQAGHPGEGHVTLMLHTFLGADEGQVRARVEGPFRNYLRSSADLMRGLARSLGLDMDAASFSAADLDALASRAFERYFETSGLFGTPRSVRDRVEELRALGVDEVGCLIDFGVDTDAVLASLPYLEEARRRSERDGRRAPGDYSLPAQVRQHGVTHLQCTPSLARALTLDEEALRALSTLHVMMVGGEALPVPLAGQLRDTVGGRVLNMYGPTETTIWSATHQVGAVEGSVPIGTPIANTALYVLDARLQPVPVGVAGELFIGGDGVVRGYQARPELTAERFLPDPFSGTPGARMYRTGDLARWRADGTVEFLGRVDQQVKVRGFRIELGEVEAALARFPAVRQAVVAAREDAAGDKRLVGYVVARPGQELDVAALRTFVQQRLPEYMVPSILLPLEALPLTPNGKVDRKALPAPTGERPQARQAFVAPRNALEQQLAQVLAQVLGVERVGIHDNFFELGGHSLLATQALDRIRRSLGRQLALGLMFQTPTVAGLAAHLEAQGGPTQEKLPLRRIERGAELPLSFAQERMWFIHQLDPRGAAYNVPVGVRFRNALDVGLLERSFRQLLQRHESLRCTFTTVEGRPVQRVADTASVELPLVDLRHLPAEAREAAALERAREVAIRPFDLQRGPLLRLALFQLGAEDHLLVMVMHHIVTDGWSLGVLSREVMGVYEALAHDRPSPYHELSIQYADFAHWQREWMRQPEVAGQLDYWKKALAGAPAALELPTDRPRPAIQTYQGARHAFHLSRPLLESLQALSQRENSTLFMTLLASFQLLLHRHSGQADISVGSPIAGRDRAELEGLIGFFINTLVLRTRFDDVPTFRALLQQVRETALGAYAHQDVPFEKLVEELRPERDLSRTPLFQVMFVLQNAQGEMPELAGRKPAMVEVHTGTSMFDLHLHLSEEAGGLAGAFEYNTALFDAETIARMAGHFHTLLEGIAAHPERPLHALPLLGEAERRQLLVEWNDTRRERTPHLTLHGLIEAQVERTPDAVAVSFEGQQLTYRELDGRANQLARHLRSLGVGPEVPVGLCMERSLEMVVGLLGVLKAGGAYVPIDPSYPRDRLEYMLSDAAAPVLLTQARLAAQLPEGTSRVVCLDSDWEAITRNPPGRLPCQVDGHGMAYIIYTSGSTGRPKGAMNTHTAICNRLLWMQEAYGLGAGDRVLQKTPFSFDVSVWEFFWPLMTGARLVVARPGGHQDAGYLIRLIVEEQVTTLHFVPSMLQVFLEQPGVEDCASLRRVICSGEALPVDAQERCLTKLGAELHNLYGPTEAAVDVTSWACQRGGHLRSVPIGRPIANTHIHVLDRHMQPVPVGVAGELFIGGVPLARGYWRRPELTAERFVPDPYSSEPGARLYRTGDLVRYLADGAIEYLGRMDHQVKLRGFRIELGEVESVIAQHPAVREAVVLVREDVPGDKRMVAYLVAREQPPTAAELRGFLRDRLPEYMVPSAFLTLPLLPLTPNGKLDRKALPAPDGARPEPGADYVAPRNDLEQRLTALWEEVLRVPRVGLNDRFFDLGGNSLLIVQVHGRMRGALGLEVPLTDLFQYPTIGSLVEHLSRPSEAADVVTDDQERVETRRDMLQQAQSRRRARTTQQEMHDDEE